MTNDSLLFEGDTDFGHYQVVDTIYNGRKARVLYSGNFQTAQSGIANDDGDLLFDYNERFMELARGLLPQSVLLIGGGACTLPIALLKDFPLLELDIVELDPKLVDLAEAFFDFTPGPNTTVHIDDGRHFLSETQKKYDLIVVDAFIKAGVPKSLQTTEAAHAYSQQLSTGGVLAMNVIASFYGKRSTALRRKVAAFDATFCEVTVFPAGREESLWLPQNFVIVAQQDRRDLEQYIRYNPTVSLETTADEALTDTN